MDDSYKLTPVYIVGITDFIFSMIPANDKLINRYSIRNVKNVEIAFTDSLNYVTVELPKLPKSLAEVKDRDELILLAIKNIGQMEEMPQEYVGSGLEKMFRLSNFANMTEAEQYEYLARFMYERDAKSSRRYAREVGLAEGKAEAKEEIARNMKRLGLDPAVICQATGLTPDEVAQLPS